MRVVAIVQARMGSTRLPDKVLKPLGRHPVLHHVLRRVEYAVPQVILAIPDTPENAPLKSWRSWVRYEGSERDVLARYWGAALSAGADYVVRVTSDCPLIDPDDIRMVVAASVGSENYARTHPMMTRGRDVECFPVRYLAAQHHLATTAYEREHVTPGIGNVHSQFVGNPDRPKRMRWTLDTEEDYAWFCRLAQHVNTDPPHPTTEEVLDYIHKTGDVLYEPEA